MTAEHETVLRLLDDIIRRAVAAKDLLLAAPLAPCGDTGEHFPHGRCPGVAGPPLPAANCPICGGHLAGDGSHVSATSGAHIPAEPQQVST